MRILITNTGPWGTGSGTVADGVMNELHKRGHEVRAFFPDTGLPGADNAKYYGRPERYHIVPFPATIDGVHLYTFPLIIPDPNPRNYDDAWTFKQMPAPEFNAAMAYITARLSALLDDFRPEVIECQHIWAFDHILGQLGYHYVCVAHHSDQMGFTYDPRMQPYATASAHRASYIFAISDYVRREVINLYGVTPDKTVTLPNGYDQDTFSPAPPQLTATLTRLGISAPDNLPIITFCGKISHTKGVDTLLEANHLIQARHPTLLLLAGGGTLETRFSPDERARLCLENVHFVGHRPPEELAAMHQCARLSVLPSRNEGFGIAALEAMGCGIPLVATRTGGLGSFVVGDLVPTEDPAALAESILGLLALPEPAYRRLCAEAYHTARTYSWSAIVEQRLPYYELVAEKNALIAPPRLH